jgi:hypothetical protein
LKETSQIAIASYCFGARIEVVLSREGNAGRVVMGMLQK